MIPGIGLIKGTLKLSIPMTIAGATFTSTNSTNNWTFYLPEKTSETKLYLFIVYENSTTQRPTISGFNIIASANGGPLGENGVGPISTVVLLSGTTNMGSIVIPNDSTYNGFTAACVGINNSSTVSNIQLHGVSTSNVSITKTKSSNQLGIIMAGADMSSVEVTSWTLDSDYTSSYTYQSPQAASYRGGFVGCINNTSTSNNITYYTTTQNGVYYYSFNLS